MYFKVEISAGECGGTSGEFVFFFFFEFQGFNVSEFLLECSFIRIFNFFLVYRKMCKKFVVVWEGGGARRKINLIT